MMGHCRLLYTGCVCLLLYSVGVVDPAQQSAAAHTALAGLQGGQPHPTAGGGSRILVIWPISGLQY
jgi:hypothetical protein